VLLIVGCNQKSDSGALGNNIAERVYVAPGALFQNFFGSGWGMIISMSMLLFWTLIPVWLLLRMARKKDF